MGWRKPPKIFMGGNGREIKLFSRILRYMARQFSVHALSFCMALDTGWPVNCRSACSFKQWSLASLHPSVNSTGVRSPNVCSWGPDSTSSIRYANFRHSADTDWCFPWTLMINVLSFRFMTGIGPSYVVYRISCTLLFRTNMGFVVLHRYRILKHKRTFFTAYLEDRAVGLEKVGTSLPRALSEWLALMVYILRIHLVVKRVLRTLVK